MSNLNRLTDRLTDDMSNDNIARIRESIINALSDFDSNFRKADWLLLGTSGCHLCDHAEVILRQLQAVYPISYQLVDIADFDEPLMMTFATTIPVVITQNSCLNYPFSVMDLQQLIAM